MLGEMVEGDALGGISRLTIESVDAVIMDPPYCSGGIKEAGKSRAPGQGLRSETLQRFGWFRGDDMGTAGLVWLLRAIAFESIRVMREGASLVVFCDWRMMTNLAPAIESAGLRFQNLIVWDKRSMGLGVGFRMQHELALHFVKGSGIFHDKGTSNVLQARRVHPSERVHPAQKPIDLMRQIVRVVAPVGGLVVDPFAGSGSTGVAAILEGRRFIGIEREAAHVNVCRLRLAEASFGIA